MRKSLRYDGAPMELTVESGRKAVIKQLRMYMQSKTVISIEMNQFRRI